MRQPAITGVSTCSDSLPPSRRYVSVHLLTGQTLSYSVDVKCRLVELYNCVTFHLNSHGMQDTNLFGLALLIDGEYVFVDQENKIAKYAPKQTRTANCEGLDGSNQSPTMLQFSFRVKYYVDCHLLLRDRLSRHHYYLQLRENVRVLRQPVRHDHSLLLASWALQADLGNYSAELSRNYFQPANYLPPWLIDKLGVDSILDQMPALHRENVNMGRTEAQLTYIREASAFEAPHNLHVYRLRRRKCDLTGSVLLGVCPNGVELYEEEKTHSRKLLASFVWTNIGNLSFEKRKFEIRAMTQRFTFYTSCDEKAKLLFALCRGMHMFTQSLKDRLAQLKHSSDDDSRGCYGSSAWRQYESASTATECWRYLHEMEGGGDPPGQGEQHVSGVSNTSSNTTSGVVSDRTTHSLESSEDEAALNGTATESAEGQTSIAKKIRPLATVPLSASPLLTAKATPTMLPTASPRKNLPLSAKVLLPLPDESTCQSATGGSAASLCPNSASAASPSAASPAAGCCSTCSAADEGAEESGERAALPSCHNQLLQQGEPEVEQLVADSRAGAEFYNLSEDYDSSDKLQTDLADAVSVDYSVHSAHTSVGSVVTTPGTFPRRITVSHTFDTDSDYVQVPYDEHGRFRILATPEPCPPPALEPPGAAAGKPYRQPVPAGVAMSTVTTVTQFGVAQSGTTLAPGGGGDRSSELAQVVVTGPSRAECQRSGETAVRFITCRLQVTRFNAQVSIVPLQSASFAAAIPSALASARATVSRFCNRRQLAELTTLSPAERLQQQLLSDADYVIYPMKDPLLSRQEYVDAKQWSRRPERCTPPYPPPPYCQTGRGSATLPASASTSAALLRHQTMIRQHLQRTRPARTLTNLSPGLQQASRVTQLPQPAQVLSHASRASQQLQPPRMSHTSRITQQLQPTQVLSHASRVIQQPAQVLSHASLKQHDYEYVQRLSHRAREERAAEPTCNPSTSTPAVSSIDLRQLPLISALFTDQLLSPHAKGET